MSSVPARFDGANLTENAAKIVISKPRRLSQHILLSYLDSYAGQSQIRERINALGQPKLALEKIRTIQVLIPSFPEQQAIAGLLDGVDLAVAEAKRERDGLELLKESTADALLCGAGAGAFLLRLQQLQKNPNLPKEEIYDICIPNPLCR